MKLSIYGMKCWQFWCNVIWKFVEDIFTYHKAPFKNFVIYSFLLNQEQVIFGGGVGGRFWVYGL